MRFQAFLAATFVAAVLALGSGAGKPPPDEPASKDAYPNGCVSCHVKGADGDHRLAADLTQLKHPSLSMVKNVPADCLKCHRSRKPAFGPLIHVAHFGKGAGSIFNQKFGGNCAHCHTMNAKTGVAANKSGPKNW